MAVNWSVVGPILSSAISATGDVAVAKVNQKSGAGNTGIAGASSAFNLGDYFTLPTVNVAADGSTQSMIKWLGGGLLALGAIALAFFAFKKKRRR